MARPRCHLGAGGAALRVPIRLLVAAVRGHAAGRTGPCSATTLAKLGAAAGGGHCRSAWRYRAVGVPPCYRAKLLVCCLGAGSSALLRSGAPTPCSMAGGAGVLGGGAFCGVVLGRVRLTPYDGILATRVRAEHRTPLRGRARSRAPCWRGMLNGSRSGNYSILQITKFFNPLFSYPTPPPRRPHGSRATIRAAGPIRCRLHAWLRPARQHPAMPAPCRAKRRGRGSGGCAHGTPQEG